MKLLSRHLILKRRAELIDQIIDHYIKVRKRKNFPKQIVNDVVSLVFRDSYFVGRGFFKEVHAVRSRKHKHVIKLSSAKSTAQDWNTYTRLPPAIRNRYFAKIYWRTKYCQLQRFGTKSRVPSSDLMKLRAIGKKYGLIDIKEKNIRKVRGRFKIVDANPSHRGP